MNITFNFKNFEPSDHLRDYARKRFEKLSKYTTVADASEVQVNLAVEKTRQMADVIFLADNMTHQADILLHVFGVAFFLSFFRRSAFSDRKSVV